MRKLILLFAIIFASCHQIHDGWIESKYTKPAHQESYTQTHKVGKQTYTTWHTRYVPEKFYFTVRGKNEEGKTVIETFQVSASYYSRKKVADVFHEKESL